LEILSKVSYYFTIDHLRLNANLGLDARAVGGETDLAVGQGLEFAFAFRSLLVETVLDEDGVGPRHRLAGGVRALGIDAKKGE